MIEFLDKINTIEDEKGKLETDKARLEKGIKEKDNTILQLQQENNFVNGYISETNEEN